MFSIDIDDDLELQDLVPHFQRVDISGDDNTGVSSLVFIFLYTKRNRVFAMNSHFQIHIVDISNLDYLIHQNSCILSQNFVDIVIERIYKMIS